MTTCQARNGEFECGLLPLKDGLCEQHYRMFNNNESATKDCYPEWPPIQSKSKSNKDLKQNKLNSRNESNINNNKNFDLDFDRYQYNTIKEQFKQPHNRLLEDSRLFNNNEIHISEHIPINTKLD